VAINNKKQQLEGDDNHPQKRIIKKRCPSLIVDGN
jgi:hypothetical protein